MTTPAPATSGLYGVIMKGALMNQIRELQRLTGDAKANEEATDDGDPLHDQWHLIHDAAEAELAAAEAAWAARFDTTQDESES
jgi:hypothetical protein